MRRPARRRKPLPRIETAWILLLRLPGGEWIVDTDTRRDEPYLWPCEEWARQAIREDWGEGFVKDFRVCHVGPTPRLLEAYNLRLQGMRRRWARMRTEDTLKGYLAIGPGELGGPWGVLTTEGFPWMVATEQEACQLCWQARFQRIAANVWPVMSGLAPLATERAANPARWMVA